MTLNYEQTAEDFIDFNYYFNWHDPRKKIKHSTNALMILFIFCFFIYLMKGFNFSKYGPGESFLLGLGFLFFFIQGDLVRWNCKRLTRDIMEHNKTIDLFGPRTVTLEEEQLVETTTNVRSEISWSAFERLEETKAHFFLFFNGNQGIIIPKRIFSQAEEQDHFRSLVNEKLNVQP